LISTQADTLELPPWRRKPPPINVVISGGREIRIAVVYAIGRDSRYRDYQ